MRKLWVICITVVVIVVSAFLTGCPQSGLPSADFSADVTSGPAPLTVQFTDLSIPGDSPIIQWRWSFGDSVVSAKQNPVHTYAAAGRYSVSLYVFTAKSKNMKSQSDFIEVTEGPASEGEGEASVGEGEGEIEGEGEGEASEGEGESSQGEIAETIMLPGDVPLIMDWCPAGTFTMGRRSGEQDSSPAEAPSHQVTFATGFWIGKYVVTQAQWKAIMNGENPSFFQGVAYGNTDNRPVEKVSWDAITQTFLPALNAATGLTFRLPSEAEWEYACRAGEHFPPTRFYWGDDPGYTQIGDYAWYVGNSDSQTHDVGMKLPNAWGLCDTSGNVWEWCEDWWHDDYKGAPTDGSAWEAPAGAYRVLRGGAWTYDASDCRSASRTYADPALTYRLGFRICR